MLNLHTESALVHHSFGRVDRALTGSAYDLLAAVCEHISARPELFDQGGLRHSVVWWLVTLYDGPLAPDAGDWIKWLDRARMLLGMPTDKDDLLDYVALLLAFTPSGRPGTRAYAQEGIRRLKAFMVANERHLRDTRLP